MRNYSSRDKILATVLFILVTSELWTARWLNDARHGDSNDPIPREKVEENLLWNFTAPSNSTEIRKWGCNRTETPFIFVHIGKAGGGSVRARIAASSLNYTKTNHRELDGSYYPLPHGEKARYITSIYSTHLPSKERTFEGTNPCHASTPLGQAIGCPETLGRIRRFERRRHGECNVDLTSCQVVYAGHNFLGSEMHWLPVRYLQNWWSSLSNKPNAITPLWNKLLPNETWCSSKKESRPERSGLYKESYEECSIPLQREVDMKTIHALMNHLGLDDSRVVTSWSPLYASLPVLRVTVMRDPFTWLLSKYFWHRTVHDKENNSTCHNAEQALLRNAGMPRPHELQMDDSGPGWISRMSLGYIMYLCGEDCIVRYAAGTATLQDLERQAESNLRDAFAVVGILEEGMDTFYEMLSARVQYVDTSLNPQAKGDKHSTGRGAETRQCHSHFQRPRFQAKLLQRSAELRALNRLYHVAKEVNKFQLNELRQCSGREQVAAKV